MKLLACFCLPRFLASQPAAISPTDYWDLQQDFIFITFTGVQFAAGHKKFKVPKLKSSPARRFNRSMMGRQGCHASWGDPHFIGGWVGGSTECGLRSERTIVFYLASRPKVLEIYAISVMIITYNTHYYCWDVNKKHLKYLTLICNQLKCIRNIFTLRKPLTLYWQLWSCL